jgi:hypothetical protein
LTEDKALHVKARLGTVIPALRWILKEVLKKPPHDPGGRKKGLSAAQRTEVV